MNKIFCENYIVLAKRKLMFYEYQCYRYQRKEIFDLINGLAEIEAGMNAKHEKWNSAIKLLPHMFLLWDK